MAIEPSSSVDEFCEMLSIAEEQRHDRHSVIGLTLKLLEVIWAEGVTVELAERALADARTLMVASVVAKHDSIQERVPPSIRDLYKKRNNAKIKATTEETAALIAALQERLGGGGGASL